MFIASALVAALAAASPAGIVKRDRPYDVAHYRLDVRLQNDGSFQNKASIRLTPKRATAVLELDAYGLDVAKVTASTGEPVTFTVEDDAAARTGRLTIRAKKPFAARKELTLEVDYSGKANSAHEGLFRVDPDRKDGAPLFFTQFQPSAAQRFFPANDQPDDKATSELFVITDRRYTVLSNGKKLKDETFAEGGENLRRVHWSQETPHSTYLVALAVGEFEAVPVGSSVPATIWVQKGTSDRAFIARAATLNTLGFLSGLTQTKYPWAKYDQVVVPRFFWNGMENTSLVMMREDALVLDTKTHFYGHAKQIGLIAHEAAHQWFGDYVTPKGWEDTWLNEGFATYVGSLAVDDHFENDFVEISRAERLFVDYVRDDAGPRSHPLVTRGVPSPEAIFDSTSYAKGAAVLRMLDFWVGSGDEPGTWKQGSEPFRQSLKAYLEKYAHANATSADFFSVVQKVADDTAKQTKKSKSARAPSIKAFQDSWLTRRGYPILTPETSWSGSTLTVKITQRPSAPGEKGPFVFKLPVVFHRSSSPTYSIEQTLLIDKPVTTFRFELPATPQWVNWNKDGVALAQVWPAAIGEQEWTLGARRDPDPVWRLLSLYALTAELASNEGKDVPRPADSVVGTLLDVITQDESPYVREALMHRLSETRWKRLPFPEDFARAVLAVAKRPEKLPEDAMGTIRVRRAALELLGKLEFKEGHTYLLSTLNSGELAKDINYLPALTAGVARIGESNATASLLAAVNGQRRRGYAYFRSAAESLGSIASPDGVGELKGFLASVEGNPEIAKAIFGRLETNEVVRASPQLASLIADFVIAPGAHGDDVRARAVRVLDEVKTPEAKAALTLIVEKSPSARLQGSARQVLAGNFPETAVKAVPVKGTRRKK